MVDDRVKVNPLAGWTAGQVENAFRRRALPRQLLFDDGYRSIGGAPCTRRPAAGADDRSGRWAEMAKTECGIHRGGVRSVAPRVPEPAGRAGPPGVRGWVLW